MLKFPTLEELAFIIEYHGNKYYVEFKAEGKKVFININEQEHNNSDIAIFIIFKIGDKRLKVAVTPQKNGFLFTPQGLEPTYSYTFQPVEYQYSLGR